MVISRDSRQKIIGFATTLFFATSIFYFSYHAITGQKGLVAMFKLSKSLEKAKGELDTIKIERLEMESRVGMLYNNSLNTDMLDEQARKQLGVAKPNEIIYFIPKGEMKKSKAAEK